MTKVKSRLLDSNRILNHVDEYLFEAKFLVGCDGANSTTRRMSMIPFEGFTWRNFRFVASDVQYDFVEHCGFGLANFIVDPDHWAVIAKTGKENIWRVCYGILFLDIHHFSCSSI